MHHELNLPIKIHVCNFAILVLLIGASTANGQEIGKITWTICLSADCSDIHEPQRIRFGRIVVPEDYRHPESSRRLQVAFAIIKARSTSPKQDPVIIFAGGWGSPILSRINFYLEYPLGENRDLILYDYRGLGYSQPLICPGLGERVYRQLLSASSYSVFSDWQQAIFDQCLDALSEAVVDPNLYGTEERSLDANLLAEKLEYDEYNIFGTSGGTRAIQSFLRNTTVPIRSAILDSTVPLGYPMIFDVLDNYAQSLTRLFNSCKQDVVCSQAYPKLEERFFAFLDEVDKKPLKLRLKGRTKVYLNRQEVNALVYNQLYDYRQLSFIPFFLESLIKRKRYVLRRVLRPWEIEKLVTESINGPGFLNYMNDYKVFQPEVEPASYEDIKVYEVLDPYWIYFESDQRFEASEKERVPVISDVPMLFLSGEYDPTTRLRYTELLLPNFSNSFHLVFPKAGHGLFFDDCAQEAMQTFLDETTSLPSPICLLDYNKEPLTFFVRGRRSQ